MKILQRPVPATILFGLVCGISFIPLNLVFKTMFFRPSTICLTLWLFSAGYMLLLGQWSKTKIIPILFPLIVLFMAVFLVKSVAAFFFLVPAIISWVRSGICFQNRIDIKLVVEMLLYAAGGALIAALPPGSAFGWTLSIWMFFLVQALYFVVFDITTIAAEEKIALEIDPFERASRRAADILSAGGKLYPN